MSDSNRGEHTKIGLIGTCLVAVVGVAMYWAMFYSMGFASGQHQRQAYVEREHHASDTPKQIEGKCGSKAGAEFRECVAEIVQTERESQRSESDLAAQWKAADWVMWAGVLAGAQLIATAVGLFYVRETLRATVKAVEETGDATRHMEEANRIARAVERRADRQSRRARFDAAAQDRQRLNSERRQLRAYVDFETVELAMSHKSAEPGHCWRGTKVALKNYGQTPADNLELRMVFHIESENREVRTAEDFKTGLGGIMPTDSCRAIHLFEFPNDLWDGLGEHKAMMTVTITATYTDAFDEPRVLSAAYKNDGWEKALGFVPGTRITT